MEDIQQRLKDCSDMCVKALASWAGQRQSNAAREDLLEALHELRKVAARLEIEMAVSERAEMPNRPMQIPSHRSHVRRPQPMQAGSQAGTQPVSDDVGNELPDFIAQGGGQNNQNDGGGSAPAPRAAPRSNFRRPVRRPQTSEE